MKIKYCFYIICVLILFVCAFVTVSRENVPSESQTATLDGMNSISYQKDGIKAEYPEIISGGSEANMKLWNQIISSDFEKILKIYSFRPIPGPTPGPSAEVPVILQLTYEAKLNNDRFTSILYHAAFSSEYSAHPTDLVYTTNLDKEKSSRLKLSDIIRIDENFVKNFRTWDIASPKDLKEEVKQGIKDYMASLTDGDLLMGMNAADIIGSGNLWDMYFYLTPDSLGISIGVPNYLGDHVEFEKEFSGLKEFIKPEYSFLTELK
jgi:hypothetical protein